MLSLSVETHGAGWSHHVEWAWGAHPPPFHNTTPLFHTQFIAEVPTLLWSED